MNLIDAIKSGRPFRRAMPDRAMRNFDTWMIKSPAGDFLTAAYVTGGERLRFNNPSPDDIVADDWEVEEPTVTITRKQFWEAAESVRLKDALYVAMESNSFYHDCLPRPWAMVLARKLGLEP